MTREEIEARLKAIIEERAALKAEFETLTRADDITEEQQARLDVLIGDEDNPLDKLDAEEKRHKAALAAHERFEKVPNAVERGDDRTPTAPHVNRDRDVFDRSGVAAFGAARQSEMRTRALSAIERSSDFASDDHKQQATQLVERLGHRSQLGEQILMTTDPEYRDAFYKAMSGELYNLTDGERQKLNDVKELTRAMALSDVTGVLVPSFLDPSVVITNAGSINPFRQVCRRRVDHDERVDWRFDGRYHRWLDGRRGHRVWGRRPVVLQPVGDRLHGGCVRADQLSGVRGSAWS